ncbi:hypothetical protein CQA38_08960 [Campylobacter sp. MIT 12-5580]|uniref:hypothetical protein n=1 Tax=Campylobacter sp. MIT 12-5580 TaxID=2040651 RepID=UPI0010F8BF36|nr:hypothetical protein [Campylobacter sp. MIT 12-5580]TKX28153.1 hypothetical protein CQA38_08960 [Campylobacter sp. MIT 12-5580]
MKSVVYEVGKKALCFLDLASKRHANLCKKLENSENYYVSCLHDSDFKARFFKCEIASTAFVLALLARLGSDEFDMLDEGYLSAESCLGEEEAVEILDFLNEAEFLIIDTNLKEHKDYENILFFCAFLAHKFKLKFAFSDESEEELLVQDTFRHLKELDNYDGLVLFRLKNKDKFLHCSQQFSQIAKINDKANILIESELFKLESKLVCDESLNTIIAFLDFDTKGYDFVRVKLTKI